MRNAQRQANNAYNGAVNTAGQLGGEAGGINAQLTPFLTQEMLHPQGIGQTGLSAETAAAEAGAGGAASGLMGLADQRAAASRNAGGFATALDESARQRGKAAAGESENITAGNEMLKQKQQQQGAEGLSNLYGVDTSGMLKAQSLEPEDIRTELQASAAPESWMSWVNNYEDMMQKVGKGLAMAGAGE